MTAAEVLRQARDLIADPARWTKGANARSADGFTASSSHDAVKWCAVGALHRVAGIDYSALCSAREILSRHSGVYDRTLSDSGRIVVMNDNARDHDEVLRIFDTAIHDAEAQEAARG